MKDRTEDTTGGNARLAERLREQTAGPPAGYVATSPHPAASLGAPVLVFLAS